MKTATLALAALVAAAGMIPVAASAGLPDGKIAVVRVTAIDGLAKHDGPITQNRSKSFTYDGTEYLIDRTSLPSLDGVQTLLLIDRRTDSISGDGLTQLHEQEIRAFGSTAFEVRDIKGKSLHYQVAMIGGNLRLLGDGDQIAAAAGAGGPFHIWKIEGINLVDRRSLTLR